MSTRFGQVNVFVADMATSVAFYRLLELDVPDSFEWPTGSGAQHVEIGSDDECYLALDNCPKHGSGRTGLTPTGAAAT